MRLFNTYEPLHHWRSTQATRDVNRHRRASNLKKKIASNKDKRGAITDRIDSFSTNVIVVSDKIESQTEQYNKEHVAVELEEEIKTMDDKHIEKTVD